MPGFEGGWPKPLHLRFSMTSDPLTLMHRVSRWAASLLVVGALTQCATFDTTEMKDTRSLPRPTSGLVAETANALAQQHGSASSSFLLLAENQEGLNWRLALADHAQSSIDCQYFLWDADASGTLLFSRLMHAADRGVRVRLLVDDFLLHEKDRDVAALSQHPNLDIRVYNPGRLRRTPIGRAVEFVLRFKLLNRRMHNKTFTVDNAMAVVGGRNIADHYFGLDPEYNFRDLDTLVSGEVVTQIQSGFDLFWNSSFAIPAEQLSPALAEKTLTTVRKRYRDTMATTFEDRLRGFPRETVSWQARFSDLPDLMVPGKARFIQDLPGTAGRGRPVVHQLFAANAAPEKDILLATPYLIPLQRGMERLREWRRAGAEVKVIVPSLASTNHTAAHAFYKRYREGILTSGAQLFEHRSRPEPSWRRAVDTAPVQSASTSFHLKAVAIDRRRCFIGSLNLDPRSMDTNTEDGLLIDSPPLAHQVAQLLESLTDPGCSWELSLDERENLMWKSTAGTRTSPPARNLRQRFADWLIPLLPVESQL